MLDSLDSVIAAFEQNDGSYELWRMPATRFAELAVDSRSSGAAGRVGIVTRKQFTTEGSRLRLVRLDKGLAKSQ